ncbi:MAG: ATP-dependent Clp protease ATP-binding subunit, partial [Nitrososphaerota archaeon]
MSSFDPRSYSFNKGYLLYFFSTPIGITLRFLNVFGFFFFSSQFVVALFLNSPNYFVQVATVIFGIFLTFEFYLRTRLLEIPDRFDLLTADLEKDNLANYFSVKLAKSILAAAGMARKNKFEFVDTLHLFLELSKYSMVRWIFERAGLNYNQLIAGANEELSKRFNSQNEELFNKSIQEAAKLAKLEGKNKVDISDMLIALFSVDPYLAKSIFDLQLKHTDFQNISFWADRLFSKDTGLSVIFNPAKLNRFAGLGYQWATGYILTLKQFSIDLTAQASMGDYHLVGRDKEVLALEQVLSKSSRANVLLVGDPGSGKTSIVQKFALRSIVGKSLSPIRFKRVLMLEGGSLLAGISDVGQLEERMGIILDEAQHAGNLVLYIDELQNLAGAVIGTQIVDMTPVLLPALQGDKLRVVAAVTPPNYRRFIETRPALDAAFTKINVEPTNFDETIRILEEITPKLEKRYQLLISYMGIKRIVELSNRYLPDRSLPGKAIDFLDELCVSADAKGEKVITPLLVEKMVETKTGIPITSAGYDERRKLINLESILHQRIVGQDEAVKAVANALRRARAGVRESKRPIGSFLFLGPTGVGKTETAKTVASVYFGSEKAMIRLDMSEFQHQDSVFGIIGSVKDDRQSSYLSQSIRENPYTLVLLDEIEKAHPKIMEIFLQVLDDGRLTDATGRLADFTNSIIIATSNAGAEQIRQAITSKIPFDKLKSQLIDFLQQAGIFKPEFLNRFDEIVLFKPLTVDEVIKVVELMIKDLDVRLKDKDISLVVTDSAKQKIASSGYDPVFGARSLRRYLQEKIESILARKILSGEIKRGDKIT